MRPRRKTFCCVLLLAASLVGPRVETVRAWNPPDGPNLHTAYASSDAKFNPKGHGIIIARAVKVLEGDGLQSVADFYTPFLNQLRDGVREADRGGGDATLSADFITNLANKTVAKNSYSHFYNPKTGRGLVLDLGSAGNKIAQAERTTTAMDWGMWSLFGPHAAATDMADLAYAQAVDAMRRGDTKKAMTHLGWALHYLADLCVPQHATDQSGVTPESNHVEFEDNADVLLSKPFPHATKGGVYEKKWKPSDYVKEAARLSTPWLESAKKKEKFEEATKAMIPTAERLSAGLMRRFYDLWRSEEFTVVVLTVDRVKATSDVDNESDADFYLKVSMDGREYVTGSLDGGDDVEPNKFSAFNWVFAKWLDKARVLKADGDATSQYSAPRNASPWPPDSPSFVAAFRPATFLDASFQKGGSSTPQQAKPKITIIPNTTLEVLTLGSPGKEFEEWGRKLIETGKPRVLTFRWGSKDAGVASARWEVVTKTSPDTTSVVASGVLNSVPKSGQTEMFTIDFGKFAPPSPPTTPKNFIVRVTSLDANGNQIGLPSANTVVTFQKPGPTVTFNMRPAVHPQVRITTYGPDYTRDVGPATLTVEVSNPGPTETDPAILNIVDKSRLFSPTAQNIGRLKPGQLVELQLKAAPDTSYWYSKMMDEKHGTISDGTAYWRGFFSSGNVIFEVKTTAFGDNLTDEVKLQQVLELVARKPNPDPVPITLNLWDMDGGINASNDHCDISPRGEDKELNFKYRLDGFVDGDVTAPGEISTTKVTAVGNDGDERAQIWFTIRRYPVAPRASMKLKPPPK